MLEASKQQFISFRQSSQVVRPWKLLAMQLSSLTWHFELIRNFIRIYATGNANHLHLSLSRSNFIATTRKTHRICFNNTISNILGMIIFPRIHVLGVSDMISNEFRFLSHMLSEEPNEHTDHPRVCNWRQLHQFYGQITIRKYTYIAYCCD